jgi:hypothetical protein
LLIGVYEADERHRLSTMFEETREQAAAETPLVVAQPPYVGGVESTNNPLATEAQGTITAL